MAIEDSLDSERLAIGRLERALARAESAIERLEQSDDGDGGPSNDTDNAPDLTALRAEVSAAISEIDNLLMQNGEAANG